VIGDGINLGKKKATLKNMITSRLGNQDLIQTEDHFNDTEDVPLE